ncbi:MAG: glycosyltransferase [Candidatus Eremiobacteraeota bacterium]|nr:glycosyltransferase [Candidatus Eremiobacteraeota bacterium]
MRLSVVIATRDRADFLAHALDSLESQRDAPTFETIVVDNGSRDGTRALVETRRAAGRIDVTYVSVPEPNRGKARNAGIAAARGAIVVFVDDDVVVPESFLAAHDAAHAGVFPIAASGPILNVPSYGVRPAPTFANYSGAFFCTCNVSVPRTSLVAAGGFDERFDLYGWEDTELGLRLRRLDVRRVFAWSAHLWHVKPPQTETFAIVEAKTIERARMAARLLRKDGGLRTKLATGAYGANFVRSAILAPAFAVPYYRALAANRRAPAFARAVAKAQVLDGVYMQTLRAALAEEAPALG